MTVAELVEQLQAMPQDGQPTICGGTRGAVSEVSPVVAPFPLSEKMGEDDQGEVSTVAIPVEPAVERVDGDAEFELFQHCWPPTPEGRSHMMVSIIASGIRPGESIDAWERAVLRNRLACVQRHLLELEFRQLYDELERVLTA